MRSILCPAAAAALALAGSAPAQVLVPESAGDFSRFADGDLAGQNGWVPVTTTPTGVQVSGDRAVIQGGMSTPRPDVRYPFAAPVTLAPGASYYVGVVLRVNSADSRGNFEIVGSIAGGPERYATLAVGGPDFETGPGRWRAWLGGGRQSGQGGFYQGWPTAVFNQGQTYRMVLAYDSVAGQYNDLTTLYVDPASPDRSANPAAIPPRTNPSEFPGDVTGLILTPSDATFASSPGVEFERITAGTDFAAAYHFITPVPEPSSLALLGAGAASGAALAFRRRHAAPRP